MRGKFVLIVAGALAASILPSSAATAKPIDKGHFDDSFLAEPYDCFGIAAQDFVEVRGSYLVNLRGSSPFPYIRDSARGTIVTTNLETGRTLTNKFATSSRDVSITDNGDGTITILAKGSGGARFYDSDGKFVFKDPGMTGFALTIDYGGTPLDPEDDEEVDFEIVRPSTGNSELTEEGFCELLAEHTS